MQSSPVCFYSHTGVTEPFTQISVIFIFSVSQLFCLIGFNLFNARSVIRFSTSFDIFSVKTMFTFYSFLNFVCDQGCIPVATSNFSVGNMLSNNIHEAIRERIDCLNNIKLIKPISFLFQLYHISERFVYMRVALE